MDSYDIDILPAKDFPENFSGLLQVSDPPGRLYVAGTLPSEHTVLLTVVGSRKYSSYGKDVCEALVRGLRGYDIAVVSGLALGLDSIAHRAALENGIRTVAVPASGLSHGVIYPRSHLPLAREIIKKGGALISEFEPDFKTTLWSFAKRNRIMAGLSRAVLLIEADERSGTLVTARFALEYGRDVLAVPGSVFSETSRGTNWLIREGATPIRGADDLLRALGFEPEPRNEAPDDASESERRVYGLLSEPKTRHELRAASGLSVEDENAALSMLEIKGRIKEEGGRLSRC